MSDKFPGGLGRTFVHIIICDNSTGSEMKDEEDFATEGTFNITFKTTHLR